MLFMTCIYFFLGTPLFLQGHVLIYIVPLWFRLYSFPLAAVHALTATTLLFQPYPAVSDYAFIITLLLFHWRVSMSMIPFSKLFGISIVGLVMMPVMTCLWLGRNTGNANFLYFMQLVHHTLTGVMLIEWIRGFIGLHCTVPQCGDCLALLLQQAAAQGEASATFAAPRLDDSCRRPSSPQRPAEGLAGPDA
eukprot:GHVT01042073.1.p1 GENE.GHVT01042073.1~~GHVT01042073.1.p1  ORF type:complete len:192 (-),score=28.69 GHVT01042073.1:528-1103(-)